MSSDKKIMKVEESTSEIEDLKQSVEALKTVSTGVHTLIAQVYLVKY